MKYLVGSTIGERILWCLMLSVLGGSVSEIASGQPVSDAVHNPITVDKRKITVYDSAHIDRLQQIFRIAKVVYYPKALKPKTYFEGYSYKDVCSDNSEVVNTDPQKTSPDSWLIVQHATEESGNDNHNTKMIGWRLTIDDADNHEDAQFLTLKDVCDVFNQWLSNMDDSENVGSQSGIVPMVRNQWVLASEYPIKGKSKESWLWTEEEILDR